ncbi:MAG: nucleotidyltransferase family protein [Candidatus Alkaliphilus sp. MAG34]
MNIINVFNISTKDITAFCNKHYIRKLAVFGSALRRELKEDSDIDILVEFHQEHIPSLFELVDMEEELSVLFDGRKIDLRTPNDLSRYFRNKVINNADVLYVKDTKAE